MRHPHDIWRRNQCAGIASILMIRLMSCRNAFCVLTVRTLLRRFSSDYDASAPKGSYLSVSFGEQAQCLDNHLDEYMLITALPSLLALTRHPPSLHRSLCLVSPARLGYRRLHGRLRVRRSLRPHQSCRHSLARSVPQVSLEKSARLHLRSDFRRYPRRVDDVSGDTARWTLLRLC